MQSESSIDSDLQWICFIQKFQFFKNVVVKELSVICIQTGEVKTWHVSPGVQADVDFNDEVYQALYQVQHSKHGLGWHDGDVSMREVELNLRRTIDENSTIFVTCWDTQDLLEHMAYNDIQIIKLPPITSFDECPKSTCRQFGHVEGFKHCSQRACVETMIHLRPFLLPTLYPNFDFRGGNYSEKDYKCLHFQLSESLYSAIGKLHDNAVHCGQLRMAWTDVSKETVTEAVKASLEKSPEPEGEESVASTSTTGTIGD
jgi:hypothetical protein